MQIEKALVKYIEGLRSEASITLVLPTKARGYLAKVDGDIVRLSIPTLRINTPDVVKACIKATILGEAAPIYREPRRKFALVCTICGRTVSRRGKRADVSGKSCPRCYPGGIGQLRWIRREDA